MRRGKRIGMSSRSGVRDPRATGDINSLPPPRTAPTIPPPPERMRLLKQLYEQERVAALQQTRRMSSRSGDGCPPAEKDLHPPLRPAPVIPTTPDPDFEMDRARQAATTIQRGYLRHVLFVRVSRKSTAVSATTPLPITVPDIVLQRWRSIGPLP